MKKNSLKGVKGNLKISSFFKKETVSPQGGKNPSTSATKVTNAIEVESDEDFQPSTRKKDVSKGSKPKENSPVLKKRKLQATPDKVNNENDKTDENNCDLPPKKKINNTNNLLPLKISDENSIKFSSESVTPSTNPKKTLVCMKSPNQTKTDTSPNQNEFEKFNDLRRSPRNATNTLNNVNINSPDQIDAAPVKPLIFLKTPDKLLTPEALKRYQEREETRKATPRKLFNENSEPVVVTPTKSTKTPQKPTSSTKIIQNRKAKSPTPKKARNSVKKDNEALNEDNTQKTPNKIRKTPKKLFDKSPDNLDRFNIKVMDKYVKITPTKAVKVNLDNEVEILSGEKKQSSILKFVVPSPSPRSKQAQHKNEMTPTRHSPRKIVESPSLMVKAKTKLDFSNGTEKQNVDKQLERRTSPRKKTSENNQNICNSTSRIQNLELDFEDSWDGEISTQVVYTLDLSTSQHCKIVEINKIGQQTVVVVESTKTCEREKCILKGFWVHLQIDVEDIVHITAKKNSNNEWIVDNEFGLIVYQPDMLISSTSVVNTVFCKRKSVLSEKFHGFEPSNKAMIVGNVVHSLLQSVLTSKPNTSAQLEKIVKHELSSRKIIQNLYEADVPIEVVEAEVMTFIPKILDFLKTYVQVSQKRPTIKKDDWKGIIRDVDDIEENIWCPELGIKGKIDVSITTGQEERMPLELKTGRATVSLEHRGQVILYVMMMNKLGYSTESGLLLYLREGVLREIPVSHKEKRDIMMLRNELTYYLTRKPKINIDNEPNMIGKDLNPPELPEPINHPSCQQCPYKIICAADLKYNNCDISSKKHLKTVQNEELCNLSDQHLEYFKNWTTLLALEANTQTGSKNLREIYTVPPNERESHGKCITNLKVTNVGFECNGVFEHTFEKSENEPTPNFMASGILENKYVVVSTDRRPAVAAGFVTDITSNMITITLDRNLQQKYSNTLFHVDTYDSNSIQTFNMASLALILDNTSRGEELRKIIVDKVIPTFETKLPKVIAVKGTPILRRLNKVQQRAVLKALAAKDYLLIKGMPGTGKTSTIVALIQLLVELNKTVLITSHTHSAVDNVCTKLIKHGIKLMRLGAESRINSSLKPYSEHNLTKNCKTPEELQEVYNNSNILAVTCLGSGHPVLTKRTMDVCIVDESTQVLQSSIIRPLYAAKTFVLIGDPDQLPPVVKNKDALMRGMSNSLFERLDTEEATVALNINYRMNKPITALANYFTYKGELLIANDEIGNAHLKLPNKKKFLETYNRSQWIINVLNEELESAVEFLDTGPTWGLTADVDWLIKSNKNGSNKSLVNIYEVGVVVSLVKALLEAEILPEDIGVIASYNDQVAQISALLASTNVDVSTVDQFQGKDKNIIIYSCTKSRDVSIPKKDTKFEILEDKRRLNVAITRAKCKLIFVGDLQTLKGYSTFSKILEQVNIIKLEENTDGFKWTSILKLKN